MFGCCSVCFVFEQLGNIRTQNKSLVHVAAEGSPWAFLLVLFCFFFKSMLNLTISYTFLKTMFLLGFFDLSYDEVYIWGTFFIVILVLKTFICLAETRFQVVPFLVMYQKSFFVPIFVHCTRTCIPFSKFILYSLGVRLHLKCLFYTFGGLIPRIIFFFQTFWYVERRRLSTFEKTQCQIFQF